MRKVILISVSVCLLVVLGTNAGGQSASGKPKKDTPRSGRTKDEEQPNNQEEPSIWMKQKLAYSQRILNGLATEDYEMIEENAIAMKGMSRIEGFVRGKTEGYRTQLKTFEFATTELIRASEQENLDGATLAFTQMTISCVNCHKEIRNN